MGNGLVFQKNLEYGVYIDRRNFSFIYRMILVRLRAKRTDAGLYSLRFIRSYQGSLAV